MSPLRSLLLLSGNLGKSATSLLILAAFARLSGAAGAGEFSFAMAVSFPVFVIAELALRNVYQTMQAPPAFRTFLALRMSFAASAATLVSVGAILIHGFPSAAILVTLLAMRWADSALDMCYGRLQAQGRLFAAAGWMWVNTSISLVAIIVPIWLRLGAWVCIAGSAASSWLVLLVLAPALLRGDADSPRAQRDDVKRVLRAGATLGLAQGLDSFMLYLPTLYLASAASKEAVGVFAVCQYVVTLANMFFSSVMQTSLSPMRRTLAESGLPALERQGVRFGTYVTAMGLVGAVLAVVFLPALAPVVFDPEFDVSGWDALPVALAAVALGAEYATTAVQLVLNRYGSRVRATLLGTAFAIAVASITYAGASVATAGYVLLAAMVGRAASSAWTLRRAVDGASRQEAPALL